MIKVDFEPWHHMAIAGHDDSEWAENIAKAGPACTGMVGDKPVICAGAAIQNEGRAIIWAVLSQDAGPHMLSITRHVHEFLDSRPEERLEMDVLTGFAAAHRWAKMLGFVREGTRRKFCDGHDFDLYARIRDNANHDQIGRD